MTVFLDPRPLAMKIIVDWSNRGLTRADADRLLAQVKTYLDSIPLAGGASSLYDLRCRFPRLNAGETATDVSEENVDCCFNHKPRIDRTGNPHSRKTMEWLDTIGPEAHLEALERGDMHAIAMNEAWEEKQQEQAREARRAQQRTPGKSSKMHAKPVSKPRKAE